MNVRFSTCIGLPVVDSGLEETVGLIADILIHPDTGKIEGFFVVIPRFLSTQKLFLSTMDIVRWGTKVFIRDADTLGPLSDYIRLESLANDPRRILGQLMRTESGTRLGMCKDVQFNTDTMQCEWLFPRKLFTWGMPLPLTEVIEVTEQWILLKDPPVQEEVGEHAHMPELDVLEPVTEATRQKDA